MPAKVVALPSSSQLVKLDTLAAQETRLMPEDSVPELSDAGYQMYFTSGTTSLPKAVLLTHRIVCSHAMGAIQEMRFHQDDVWFHVYVWLLTVALVID